MTVADQLTVARLCSAPVIVLLFVVDLPNHDYLTTALFAFATATDPDVGVRAGLCATRARAPWHEAGHPGRQRTPRRQPGRAPTALVRAARPLTSEATYGELESAPLAVVGLWIDLEVHGSSLKA
jgi:hypothetical protein